MGTRDAGPVGEGTGVRASGVGVSGAGETAELVRAAAALRWNRPDLTSTLAELALESATDAEAWVAAAGWLLHGRAALGDGRDTACDLLDGLDRWAEAGVGPLGGPAGRRLRVELAGPARRIGEPVAARVLLAAAVGGDDDPELRADVLTELARCALDATPDTAPDTADEALAVAEEAWRGLSCSPGVASVVLLRAARDRRAGRADDAVTQAVAGLAVLAAGGRRSGATASDHLAAALTAEWIAALVEAGRVEEARADALPAAVRLVEAARTSRQVAGLRLAIARVGAVADDPDVVLAALEPAARDAAESNVPELESACRSMLGELHETGGRLDAALGALRAAMAAERRDRDRGHRLRLRLAAAAGRWAAAGPGPDDGHVQGGHVQSSYVQSSHLEGSHLAAGHLESGADDPRGRTDLAVQATGRPEAGGLDTGRRGARPHGPSDQVSEVPRIPDGVAATSRLVPAATRAAGHGAEPGPPVGSLLGGSLLGGDLLGGSLIGDALLRELAGTGVAGAGPVPRDRRADPTTDGDRRAGVEPGRPSAAGDPLFGPLNGAGSGEGGPGRRPPAAEEAGGSGGRHDDGDRRPAPEAVGVPWAGAGNGARSDRPSALADTVVFPTTADEPPNARDRARRADPAAGGASRPPAYAPPALRPAAGRHAGPGGGGRHGVPGDEGTARHRGAEAAVRIPTGPDAARDRGAGAGDPGVGRPRPPSRDLDGLGLGDLLAGALAAYRDL